MGTILSTRVILFAILVIGKIALIWYIRSRARKEYSDGVWAGAPQEKGSKLNYHWGPGDE